MIVNANTKIYDKAVDRAAMIRLYERRVNSKIGLVIDDHETRLDSIIKSSDLKEKELLAKIDYELLNTNREMYNISKRSLLDLFSDQISYAYQNIESIMGNIWSTEKPPVRLAEEVVLLKPLYSDKTLSAGWAGVNLSERKRLEAVIRKGIAEGSDINTIALNVRKNNIHNITRNQAKSLVITAITSVTAQADHSIYKANEKAIKGYQYVAVLDSRTTPLCASRDGNIYPVGDTEHLPPAHFHCRSTTIPVFKSWDDIAKLEGVSQVRKRNIQNLSKKQIEFYDGQTPLRESYQQWLSRQNQDVQLRHLGDYEKVKLFQSGDLTLEKFTNPEGNSIGIKELRKLSDNTYTLPNDTKRFALAKQRLDAMQLGISTPDDIYSNNNFRKILRDYYYLQSTDLDGTLSLTNYRGILINTKSGTKKRVLTTPPNEDQTVFNPITGRYEDTRLYQPNIGVFNNNIKLIEESEDLLDKDKKFIKDFVNFDLADRMSLNERAVVADNLRIIFSRYRKNPEPWVNFKAIVQSQIKFDVLNVSDSIETQLRRDSNLFKKLLQDNYIDPVLGPVQLESLHKDFISNIQKRNLWEDKTAITIASELRSALGLKAELLRDITGIRIRPDLKIFKKHIIIWQRLSDKDLQQFFLKFAHRLALADTPDRDQLAVQLGRDLYNLAGLNGKKKDWYNLGLDLLESKNMKKFYEIETFGVQKRRMKSRMSGKYFGPYYDTISYNIRITDPRIQEYAKLTRKVEVGLRVPVLNDKNRLVFREGYKTYFIKTPFGLEDTRIPITSTSSFSDFPEEFLDKSIVDALNWASKTEYKIDNDFYDAIQKIVYFEDDRGKAKYYNELNELRKYIQSRGDSYERFKAMEWLRKNDYAFSNNAFIDHRARIYDRGLISPQSGETFRPFLNTKEEKNFSPEAFRNLQDQIGSFLGGLSDTFEGKYNGLSFTGRQKIAEKWRPELVKIGNHMLRGKPADIRAILDNKTFHLVEGEELTKFLRLSIETAKIDNYLNSDYTKNNLNKLNYYKTGLALEQDASSSGAQIIALTTRNKRLAELSNVIPTTQKKRLYDEIAAATYNDPRFKQINKKFGLTEKDLRKAAKAQNMVTFYGAGERTGVLNVEGKLAKVLNKEENTLVVTTEERERVLSEISARIARYERFDPETALELRQLREKVKEIFNDGLDPGDDILEELYFLDPKTRDLVEKMSLQYDKVVTPNDFKSIAKIMSEQLSSEVPILKDFTRYFGRLAEDFIINAKPSKSDFDWAKIAKIAIRGTRDKGYIIPDWLSQLVGIKAGEPLREKALRKLSFWNPNSNLADLILGTKTNIPRIHLTSKTREYRRTGAKFLKIEIPVPDIDIKKGTIGRNEKLTEIELLYANKMPKSWTNVPWVNFDGRIIEQNFTQSFEERLVYKDKDGNWTTNILQVPQKTEATWWDQLSGSTNKINDIADLTKARTAFAVNGNHSNDAVIVKKFLLWSKKNNIAGSTIHDAFFTNSADMLEARKALREIYAEVLSKNPIIMTLNEMRSRGLPKELYDKYLEEAIEKGLIPVPGKSKINGRVLTEKDILTKEDILKEISNDFYEDYGWYGVG